ncbi:MAG: hypothetical protein RIQ81_340 [Pseudomonadota bacterium]|jgi:1-acyl-sn-glycerol-3-phosphate acyltransferase
MTNQPWQMKPAKDLGLGPLERAKSLRRDPGPVSFFSRNIFWAMAHSMLKTWNGFTVEGRHNLPENMPFVLVANHSSHLDVMMMTLSVPVQMRVRLFALAAEDHFFTKVSSSFFTSIMINALPMSRAGGGKGREAIETFRERLLTESCGIIIFPEGTRTRDGKVGRFRAGIGNLVAGTNIPVVPCWIDGAFAAFPAGRLIPRRKKITIQIGKPLTFQDFATDKDGTEQVAKQLQDAVTALNPSR